MKIIELNIIQFGKIEKEKILLSSGLNIIEGKNESGKSTIQAFIKFMLFGMSGKSNIDERKKGVNWNTKVCAGSLTLEKDGNSYRIERMGREDAKGSYSEKVQVIDIKNSSEVFEDLVPGEAFLGIDANTYDSLCNIRQLDCSGIDTSAVRTSIDNLLTAGDEKLNVDKAIETLDKERVKLLHKNGKGGEIFDLDEEIEKLESEFSNSVEAEDNLRKIADEIDRNDKVLEKLKLENEKNEKMIELSSEIERLDKFRKLNKIEDDLKEIKSKSSELKSMMPSGVEPTYDDIAQMKSIRESILSCNELYSDAENKMQKISKEKDELEQIGGNEIISDILTEYGTPENYISYVNSRIQKSKFKLKLGLIFYILTALLGALGVAFVVLALNAYITATAFAIATLIAALAVVFTVQSFGDKKSINQLLSSIGNYSQKELDKLLNTMINHRDTSDKYERIKDEYERAEIILGNQKEKLVIDTKKANELLLKFGVNSENGKIENILLDISETLKKYISTRDDLQAKTRELFAVSEALKDELQFYSEKDIKEKFTPELEKEVRQSSLENLKGERDLIRHKLLEVQKYKSDKEKEEAALSCSFRGREEVWEIMKDKKAKFEAKKKRYEAITLALESLKSASNSFKDEIMPRIKALAGNTMEKMTNGKYGELGYNSDMELSIYADGKTRSVDSLSKGTVDLCYFSMRMALIYSMCKKEKPTLILDETLSQIDDERAKKVFSAVAEYVKDGGQCLLFTCQKRDLTLAKSVLETNIILL